MQAVTTTFQPPKFCQAQVQDVPPETVMSRARRPYTVHDPTEESSPDQCIVPVEPSRLAQLQPESRGDKDNGDGRQRPDGPN